MSSDLLNPPEVPPCPTVYYRLLFDTRVKQEVGGSRPALQLNVQPLYGAVVSSPGLARSGYPGSVGPYMPCQPQRGCASPYDRNPAGVGISMARLPRVGAVRQPWALLHSPVDYAILRVKMFFRD